MSFFTFFILFSYLVPISLVISMEVVKFIHATLLINNDLEMYNKDIDEPAKARTSSLSEVRRKWRMEQSETSLFFFSKRNLVIQS